MSTKDEDKMKLMEKFSPKFKEKLDNYIAEQIRMGVEFEIQSNLKLEIVDHPDQYNNGIKSNGLEIQLRYNNHLFHSSFISFTIPTIEVRSNY